jgi:hypothetical protein
MINQSKEVLLEEKIKISIYFQEIIPMRKIIMPG